MIQNDNMSVITGKIFLKIDSGCVINQFDDAGNLFSDECFLRAKTFPVTLREVKSVNKAFSTSLAESVKCSVVFDILVPWPSF